MLKARGRNLVIFGLSRMNCERLLEGKPILVDMEELGMSGKALIVGGETEEDIKRELEEQGLSFPKEGRL